MPLFNYNNRGTLDSVVSLLQSPPPLFRGRRILVSNLAIQTLIPPDVLLSDVAELLVDYGVHCPGMSLVLFSNE